jgi:hypothetical protein
MRANKSPGDDDRITMSPTPADLYAWPSFKFKHEVRPPAEPSIDAYYRAYPQFRPRPLTGRRARRQARRGGL